MMILKNKMRVKKKMGEIKNNKRKNKKKKNLKVKKKLSLLT